MRARVSVLLLVCAACVPIALPTPRPTFELSAPTLAPSPTVRILTSEELYSEESSLGQNNPTAAALPSGGGLPPLAFGESAPLDASVPIQIVLDDGVVVDGELYSSGQDRLAAVLFVARQRDIWGELPRQLFNNGYTVAVMSLRPSVPRINDLSIMLLAVSELGTVDPSRMVVIGAEDGADLTLLGCAADALCDGAVLLRPTLRDALLDALPRYATRPLFIVALQGDSLATELYAAAGNAQLRTYEASTTADIAQNASWWLELFEWLARLW